MRGQRLLTGLLLLGGLLVSPASGQAADDPPAPAAGARAEARGGAAAGAAPRGRPGPARPALIYLLDGGEPIVVQRYIEEGGEIRFEKLGGWVGIPRYEVLRIVSDHPDDAANLPPAAADENVAPEPLYVAVRGGGGIRATAVVGEGERVRVAVPEGSLTMARNDLVGILRVPVAPAPAEAWLSLAAPGPEPLATVPGEETAPSESGRESPGAAPALPTASDRPHVLQLTNGQIMVIDGFWTENGALHIRRLGGVIGLALAEVARLVPRDPLPAMGRTPARFVRPLGPDRLEVALGGEVHRIRLIGVEARATPSGTADPWRGLARGVLLHLEFDRQRYDRSGDWLAYVYLPSGRMLNAELLRAGLARPRPDGHNLRHLDLFQEIAAGAGDAAAGQASPGRAP